MRIGDFAKQHGVTIDTIRHYMDLELIIPERIGGHYSFDDICRRDMKEILWYKAAGFSLSEIQRIFIIKRFTGVKSKSDADYMKNLFLAKREELLKERFKLDSMLVELEGKINETGTPQRDKRKLGIPLSFLAFLLCPRCKSPLFLKRGEIEDNMVMEGEFGCSCGFNSEVRSGVLVISSVLKGGPVTDEHNKWDYIERTAPEFMNFMYRGYEWITKKALQNNLGGKIILEPGTGFGTFINYFNSHLPGDTFYVGTDNNLEALLYTKSGLEESGAVGNYVFISTDHSCLPLRDGSVDIVADYIGSSDYNFRNPAFLPELIYSKLKNGGKWVGAGLFFRQGSKSLARLRPECRSFFYEDNIKKKFEKTFKLLNWDELGFAERAGEFEPFFKEGDRVEMFGYYGEKTSG